MCCIVRKLSKPVQDKMFLVFNRKLKFLCGDGWEVHAFSYKK